jgi:nucleoside-diphosphate-sugar epimerase
MNILVAGATGVVGRILVPLLVQVGHNVAGTTRHAEHANLIRSLGAQPVVVDALDRDGVFAALQVTRPQVVIDQLTDLKTLDIAANARLRIEGTRNLIDAAKAVSVHRVIAQSISWAYAPGEGLAREDEPLDLDSPPPRQGLVQGAHALESIVAEISESVILRYGLLYGPGTFYAHDGMIADQVRHGTMAADDSISSFVHIEDAAHAALLALQWPRGPVNIVDDEPAPKKDWLPVYANLLGAPPPPIKSGSERGERGASNHKARHSLGWQPLYPTWREGFKVALG